MSNSNERKTHDREVRQEFYNEPSGNTCTNVTRTTETVNNSTPEQRTNSYSDGYVHGKVSERRYQENVLAERDNNNAARGLLLGIIFTSVAALAVGYTWLFNQKNEAPTSVTPTVIIPNSKSNDKLAPEAKQPPQKETIIERTRDVLVPVPQQQVPSPTPKQDINITVPNSAPSPSAEQAPTNQTSSTPSQNQSSNTDSQAQITDTDSTTPAQDTSSQTDTTSDNSSASTDSNTTNSAQ